MATMTVSEFIANFLYDKGIRDIFMLSGGGAIHLDQAVSNHKGLREICIKNEATGPMMAEAYARIKNNFGVVYVTTGPGGANAVTGVVECFVDSSPVLIISGQVPTNQTTKFANINGLRSYGIQELNIIDIVKPITKYSKMIIDPQTIFYELEKAVHIAKSGRPGPVWLDIPLDVQSSVIDTEKLIQFNTTERTDNLHSNRLSDIFINIVIESLKTAKKPLIVAGQGSKSATELLLEFAERINAPIILSRLGLDSIPLSYNLNMGLGGIKGNLFNKKIMKSADVVISIGCSMSVAFSGFGLSYFNDDAKIFMIDIDPAEIEKNIKRLNRALITNSKAFLTSILTKIDLEHPDLSVDSSEWVSSCKVLKNKHLEAVSNHTNDIHDIYFLSTWVDFISKPNDIFVNDAGSIYYVAGQTLSFDKKNQREITSGAYASMGLAIPLAIGSAVANKNSRVLAMTGDGSLETNIQELKTLSYYDLNVKLFVINNGGYISMRRDHNRHATDERNAMLNLKKVANAYEVPYFLLNSQEDWEDLKTKINESGPLFIEVICNDNQKLILPS